MEAIKRILLSLVVVFSLFFSNAVVDAKSNICGDINNKNANYLEESKNIGLDKEWNIEFTINIKNEKLSDSIFICDEDGFMVKDLSFEIKGKSVKVKNKYIYKENKSYYLIIKNITKNMYIKKFTTNSIKLNPNVEILFYKENQGYFYNYNNEKVYLDNPEAINEIEKAKVAAKFYINKHFNNLSKKGIDIDKILNNNPMYIEIFPYFIPGYAGWFQKSNITYSPPAPEMGLIQSNRDKLVFVVPNGRDKTYFNFDGYYIEEVLIHEFGHYIEHNYFNYNDYISFLTIKNLQNTEVANNIKRMDVDWSKRPSEIFAENYVELFINDYRNRTIKLAKEEKVEFEKWLFNKINNTK